MSVDTPTTPEPKAPAEPLVPVEPGSAPSAPTAPENALTASTPSPASLERQAPALSLQGEGNAIQEPEAGLTATLAPAHLTYAVAESAAPWRPIEATQTELAAAAVVRPSTFTPTSTDTSAEPWTLVLAITTVALAIRAVYVLWAHPVASALYSDMEGAYSVARTFADPHHVFGRWDTVKPRAMGFVGGMMMRWFKAQGLQRWGMLQMLISTATVPLTYVGARRFFGRRPALLAAALLAIDFMAFGFAGYLMVETYLMFFLALSFALLDPERPLLCLLSGVALGLGSLFKPQGLPLMPFWCLFLFFWPEKREGSFFRRLFTKPRVGAMLLCLATVGTMAPEVAAVSKIMGKFTFLTAYGGQNFYIGHCHVKLVAMDGGRDGTFFSGVPKVYQRDEPWPDVTFHVGVFDSGFFTREGLKCMQRSISYDVLWVGEQMLDVFSGWPGSSIDPWPLPNGPFSATRIWQVVIGYILAPLALWELWRRRREPGSWIAFAAPLAAVWGLALIFSGDPRYREPFDVFFFAGGAAGVVMLWDILAPKVRKRLAHRLKTVVATIDVPA